MLSCSLTPARPHNCVDLNVLISTNYMLIIISTSILVGVITSSNSFNQMFILYKQVYDNDPHIANSDLLVHHSTPDQLSMIMSIPLCN